MIKSTAGPSESLSFYMQLSQRDKNKKKRDDLLNSYSQSDVYWITLFFGVGTHYNKEYSVGTYSFPRGISLELNIWTRRGFKNLHLFGKYLSSETSKTLEINTKGII